MKFEKPKSAEIGAGVATVTGATVGFLAPNGIANVIAKVDDEATITEDQKNKKMYVNAACLVGGIALAMMVKGSDIGANALRGAGYGLAGGGAKGLVTHFAKDKVTTLPDGGTKRFIAGALGCACTPEYQTYPTLQMPRSLREPAFASIEESVIDPLG